MSLEIINVSTPNDGLGDTLRASQIKANNNFADLEARKVDKIAGKSLSKNDFTDTLQTKLNGIQTGAEVNVQSDWNQEDDQADDFIKNKPVGQFLQAFGTLHYSNSLETQNVVANTELKLLNNGLGAFTNLSNAPFGTGTIWNTTTNQFDFTSLEVGDYVELRPDLDLDLVGTNTSFSLYAKMAIGSVNPWQLNIHNAERKNTDVFNEAPYIGFDISSLDTRNFPAEIFIKTDANATVKVNGWLIVITRKSVNIIDIEAGDEYVANKQNNLTPDGTGVKYPTVDAVNNGVVKLTTAQTIEGVKTFVSSPTVPEATLPTQAVNLGQVVPKLGTTALDPITGDLYSQKGFISTWDEGQMQLGSDVGNYRTLYFDSKGKVGSDWENTRTYFVVNPEEGVFLRVKAVDNSFESYQIIDGNGVQISYVRSGVGDVENVTTKTHENTTFEKPIIIPIGTASNEAVNLGQLEDIYIPYTGTMQPITGMLEVANGKGFIYQDEFFINRITIEDTGIYLYCYDILNDTYSQMQIGRTQLLLLSTRSDFRGLSGDSNYSANITDLDYTQKIYVDNAIADGAETTTTILNKIGNGVLIYQQYLPSYVDDVLEFDNFSSFPVTGAIGKIYIAIDTSKQYRWTGSAYLQITNGLIGSTNDVPEGGSNLYFTTARVLSTLLSGLLLATGGTIVSTDSILVAFGKLQKQITDLISVALNKSGDTITGDIGNTSTGFFRVANGTTAQRPSTPLDGMIRYNSTTLRNEFYSNGAWRNMARLEGDTFTGNVQVPNIQRTNGSGYYKQEDGGNEWHNVRWFTPTGTFSNTGVNVTTTGGQLTASMVGSKIGVGTDKRTITAFLTANTCTVDSAFSQNYVSEPLANWGVFSRSIVTDTDGVVKIYLGAQSGGALAGTLLLSQTGGSLLTPFGLNAGTNGIFGYGIQLRNDAPISFSSTNNASGTKDAGLSRNSAGVLEINNGTAGTFRDLRLRNVIADGVVRLKNYTVATLPTGTQGDTAYVTDALSPTYRGVVVGGGSVVTQVFFNGTNWLT